MIALVASLAVLAVAQSSPASQIAEMVRAGVRQIELSDLLWQALLGVLLLKAALYVKLSNLRARHPRCGTGCAAQPVCDFSRDIRPVMTWGTD